MPLLQLHILLPGCPKGFPATHPALLYVLIPCGAVRWQLAEPWRARPHAGDTAGTPACRQAAPFPVTRSPSRRGPSPAGYHSTTHRSRVCSSWGRKGLPLKGLLPNLAVSLWSPPGGCCLRRGTWAEFPPPGGAAGHAGGTVCRALPCRGACVACWRQLGGLCSVPEPQGVQLPGTQAGLLFFLLFLPLLFMKKKIFFFLLVCSWNNEVQISFMLERFDPGCARCGFTGGWEERWWWKRAGDGTSRSARAGGASWAGWGCCRLGGGEQACSSPGQGSLPWVEECAAAVLAATLASPCVLGLAPKEVRLGAP